MTRDRDIITLEEAQQVAAITPKQARHLLGDMSKNAMYQAIHTGAIPSVRIGAKILIPVRTLLGIIEKGSQG